MREDSGSMLINADKEQMISLDAILFCQAIVSNNSQLWVECKDSNEVPELLRKQAAKQFSKADVQSTNFLVRCSYFMPSRLLSFIQIVILWSPRFSYRILRSTGVHQQHF